MKVKKAHADAHKELLENMVSMLKDHSKPVKGSGSGFGEPWFSRVAKKSGGEEETEIDDDVVKSFLEGSLAIALSSVSMLHGAGVFADMTELIITERVKPSFSGEEVGKFEVKSHLHDLHHLAGSAIVSLNFVRALISVPKNSAVGSERIRSALLSLLAVNDLTARHLLGEEYGTLFSETLRKVAGRNTDAWKSKCEALDDDPEAVSLMSEMFKEQAKKREV